MSSAVAGKDLDTPCCSKNSARNVEKASNEKDDGRSKDKEGRRSSSEKDAGAANKTGAANKKKCSLAREKCGFNSERLMAYNASKLPTGINIYL